MYLQLLTDALLTAFNESKDLAAYLSDDAAVSSSAAFSSSSSLRALLSTTATTALIPALSSLLYLLASSHRKNRTITTLGSEFVGATQSTPSIPLHIVLHAVLPALAAFLASDLPPRISSHLSFRAAQLASRLGPPSSSSSSSSSILPFSSSPSLSVAEADGTMRGTSRREYAAAMRVRMMRQSAAVDPPSSSSPLSSPLHLSAQERSRTPLSRPPSHRRIPPPLSLFSRVTSYLRPPLLSVSPPLAPYISSPSVFSPGWIDEDLESEPGRERGGRGRVGMRALEGIRWLLR